jgi:hypothetical protein
MSFSVRRMSDSDKAATCRSGRNKSTCVRKRHRPGPFVAFVQQFVSLPARRHLLGAGMARTSWGFTRRSCMGAAYGGEPAGASHEGGTSRWKVSGSEAVRNKLYRGLMVNRTDIGAGNVSTCCDAYGGVPRRAPPHRAGSRSNGATARRHIRAGVRGHDIIPSQGEGRGGDILPARRYAVIVRFVSEWRRQSVLWSSGQQNAGPNRRRRTQP